MEEDPEVDPKEDPEVDPEKDLELGEDHANQDIEDAKSGVSNSSFDSSEESGDDPDADDDPMGDH